MMRMQPMILIVTLGFVSGIHAMDSESAEKVHNNHSKMIEVLTFDAIKGRYYYKLLFTHKEKNILTLSFPRSPRDQACIDVGPANLFWIVKLCKNKNGYRPVLSDDQTYEQSLRDLGSLEYDHEAGMFFHSKRFEAQELAIAKKINSFESDLSCESSESSGDISDSDNRDFLDSIDILSFNREKRRYNLEPLFQNVSERKNILQLSEHAPTKIDLGPLKRLIVNLGYHLTYDADWDSYSARRDLTFEELEKELGPVEGYSEYGLKCYSKVFEPAD